ncbi:MAG TPA: TIGR01777 family oxidoreductase [Daejeonella sp.]|nr:TIGR01777 family oxidoreductase [Daejeonella sp.]
MRTILITGGSGLIGKRLTRLLLKKGYAVNHLSHNTQWHPNPRYMVYKWNVPLGQIDEKCLENVDAIIHLAGESIAGKRWTPRRKEQIIKSRTDSTRLLYKLIRETNNQQVKTFISASAMGFYGNRENELLTEESLPGNSFLSRTCLEWEKAVDEGIGLGLRIVKLRTGLVLAEEGGALPEIASPIKHGFGSVLGNGRQWVSWIHIRDVIRMYNFALENENMRGAYNMAAPYAVRNSELTKTIAKVLNKKLWLPPVPAFGLKLILGEMSNLLLDSTHLSSEKIQKAGFKFEFPTLNAALKEIYY